MVGDNNYEIGESGVGLVPPADDADFTWHVHDEVDSDGCFTWGYGVTCTACAQVPKYHGEGKTVRFNITRLKQDNAEGMTQLERRDEIYAAARRDGRDITPASQG